MDNIRIFSSGAETNDSIIAELMKIEADVYAPDFRGKYDSICARFHKDREMFVLAYDGKRIIGYLCFFPISKKLHSEIIHETAFRDDDILPEDILGYRESNYIYLLSIALYKAYQRKGIGKRMMNAFFEVLQNKKKFGHDTVDVLASVVTEQGRKIAEEYGFSPVRTPTDTEHFLLYRKEGNKI